jgi:5-hydroxyisourate hydrolase-like protein (transthyretin family)
MEVLYLRCGRLDIHQKTVVARLMKTETEMAGRLTAADLRLDTHAVGAYETVWDVHAGHERTADIRTGHAAIEAT